MLSRDCCPQNCFAGSTGVDARVILPGVTPAALAESVAVVRRLSAGLSVEVAAILPLLRGALCAPVLLATGTPVSVRVTPAAVFAAAIRLGVPALVLAHTHLADTPPSEADRAVTRRLTAAALIMGVPLLAHVVVTPSRAWDCGTGELLGASHCYLPTAVDSLRHASPLPFP